MVAAVESPSRQIKARDLLLTFLSFASSANSFWYTINGDASAEFSLCRRLGFFSEVEYYALLIEAGLAGIAEKDEKKEVKILGSNWKSFLISSEHGLSVLNIEYDVKKFDIDALVRGSKQVDNHRHSYHVLRIGHSKSETYTTSITRQKHQKKFIRSPPILPGLRSSQRILTRSSQNLIADVIVENEDFAKNVLAGQHGPKARPIPEQDIIPSTPTKPESTTPLAITSNALTPSPTKSKPDAETGIVEAAICGMLGRRVCLDSDDGKEAIDKLLTWLIARKQKKSGDKVVLKFMDTRNFKEAHFVRVSKNSSHSSAIKQVGWVDHCLAINGKGDVHEGAKRMTKHIKRKYQDAFDEIVEEDGQSTPRIMQAYKIAAMFNAGQVTSKKCRRAQLNILRNHFGLKAFEPEKKLQLLCEGRSEVKVGKIEYAYEDGAIPETIHYMHKNIASEVIAQLKVSMTMIFILSLSIHVLTNVI